MFNFRRLAAVAAVSCVLLAPGLAHAESEGASPPPPTVQNYEAVDNRLSRNKLIRGMVAGQLPRAYAVTMELEAVLAEVGGIPESLRSDFIALHILMIMNLEEVIALNLRAYEIGSAETLATEYCLLDASLALSATALVQAMQRKAGMSVTATVTTTPEQICGVG